MCTDILGTTTIINALSVVNKGLTLPSATPRKVSANNAKYAAVVADEKLTAEVADTIPRNRSRGEGAYAANISNDGKISVVSSIHHGINAWDLEKNALLFNWSQAQNSADNLVLAIDISDNNSHVLTADRENFALWNLQTGKSEGFWHRANILQGNADLSSGVPFHLLSDPKNLRNAYYTNSRAILGKPRFSHVDLRMVTKITVLPLWVKLNGL